MKRLCFVFILMSFALHALAQKEYTVDKRDSSAYVVVDKKAEFHYMSRDEDVISSYVNKRLDFPKEAWKECKDMNLPITITIRYDGKVSNVDISSDVNATLAERVKAILYGMPLWDPALIKGHPVTSVFGEDIYLLDDGNTTYTENPTGLPFSFLPWVKKMNKKAEEVNRPDGMSSDEAGERIALLAEIADVVPENAKTSASYMRLLYSVGKCREAIVCADSVVNAYTRKNSWDENDPEAFDSGMMRFGYEGRTEIWLRVLKALFVTTSVETQDSVYHSVSQACLAVDKKIYNHDIVNFNSSKAASGDITRMRRLMQEKCDIVLRNPEKLLSDEVEALRHERMLGPMVAMVDKYVREGKISNARVIQITHELEELKHKKPNIPDITANTVRMYAVNALLEYLYSGTAAQDRYLRSAMVGDGKPYAKELEALRSAIASAALTDADRKAVARCIAAFSPIKGVDDAKAFYALRKRVWAAYPIAWLGKCDI